jgi:hypothetical protein
MGLIEGGVMFSFLLLSLLLLGVVLMFYDRVR